MQGWTIGVLPYGAQKRARGLKWSGRASWREECLEQEGKHPWNESQPGS